VKKIILPILIFSISLTVFGSHANAQTKSDCFDTRSDESYQCLLKYNACLDECIDKSRNSEGHLYVGSNKISQECSRSVCDPANKACNDETEVNYRSCREAISEGKEEEASVLTDKKDESPLIKFFGVNPFETWLRIKSWGQVGEGALRTMDGLFNASSSIDIEYEDGITRISVDDASWFGTDLTIKAGPQIEGAQIKLPGQFEYQSLQPNQNIPNDAYIRINTPSSFVVGGEDIEVGPVNEGGQVEFLVKKSKENENVDLIESQRDELDKMTVRFDKIVGHLSKPAISPEIEKKAWMEPTSKGENVIDLPGTNDTKRYSWDTNSGVVIKSSDWKQTEIGSPVVNSGDFITRNVKFKQGEVEVKVKNENPEKGRFSVQSPDFLEAITSRTHYIVSYNSSAKQNTVVVYEGKVEVKTTDGKIIMVAEKDGRPGMVVVTKKLSVIKLVVVGMVLAVVIAGAILVIRKRK